MSKVCYLYLMQAKRDIRLFKIGIAFNPDRRKRELNMRLVNAVECEDKQEAYHVEGLLLDTYRTYRDGNNLEYFYLPETEVKLLVDAKAVRDLYAIAETFGT